MRTLSRGANKTEAVSTRGSRDPVSGNSAVRGGQLVTLGGAHSGGVLAVTHVDDACSGERDGGSGHVIMHFASGGVGETAESRRVQRAMRCYLPSS